MRAEGIPVDMNIVLFQGGDFGDPTPEEAQIIADDATDPSDPDKDFPVTYKPLPRIELAMPHSGGTPSICILGPDRTILECIGGHAQKDSVADYIRQHYNQ